MEQKKQVWNRRKMSGTDGKGSATEGGGVEQEQENVWNRRRRSETGGRLDLEQKEEEI